MSDATTPPGDRTTRNLQPEQHSAPNRIGNYRLLQKIGEGGMGEVWEAEQTEPVRRNVALKLIKWGMDTKAVVARFEAERQALALMNHPNVAKVYDAGATDAGRPYFVMELVKGVPITEHCDRQRMTTGERLELFMQACEGVQHAHQKGIIHRDIKPSNVLVAIDGDKSIPKIIDFGVAKATEQRLTEKTLFTQVGILIGTPEYMSPEQAEMTVQDIDTRTDVYSLGVLLYELLVGALPFHSKELREAGFDEIRRRIREEEPSKPSARVSTAGDASAESAKLRRTDVRSLTRQLRGDLDWITLKALEKNRTRRYGSPTELADDIGRYLYDEPVLARPPTIGYRVSKFARKNRGPVTVAAAFLAALLVGLVVVTAFYLEARRAGILAEAARANEALERDQAERRAYQANVLMADASLRAHDVAEARKRLGFCAERFRGWEWSHLDTRVDQSAKVLQHPGPVSGIAFSPDSDTLAVASLGVHLWDWRTGRREASLLEDTVFQDVLFSPEGLLAFRVLSDEHAVIDLATRTAVKESGADLGKELRFCDTGVRLCWVDGRVAQKRPGDAAERVVATEPTEEVVATYSNDLLRIRDTHSGRVLGQVELKRELDRYGGVSLLGACFLPTSSRLLVREQIRGDIVTRSWDWKRGRFDVLDERPGDYGGSFAVDPLEKTLATGARDTALRLFDFEDARLVTTLHGHTDDVEAVMFSPDGNSIVSGSSDNTVRIWSSTTRNPQRHELRVFSGVLDDGVILAAFAASDMLLVDSVTGQRRLEVSLLPDSGSARIEAVSPDATWAVVQSSSPSGDREAERQLSFSREEHRGALWDVRSGREVAELVGDFVIAVAFSADSGIVAINCSGDDTEETAVCVHSTASGDLRAKMDLAEELMIERLAFSPSGEFLAWGTDTALYLWDARTAELVSSWSNTPLPTQLAASSPDGSRHIEGSTEQTQVRVVDADTGSLLSLLPDHRTRVLAAAFDSAGPLIMTGCLDGDAKVWNEATSKLVLALSHDSPVVSVAVDSRLGLVFTGTQDDRIRVRNLADGSLRFEQEAFGGAVFFHGFGRNGETVHTISAFGNIIAESGRDGVGSYTFTAGSRHGLGSLVFGPDNDRLAYSIGTRAEVRDLATGNVVAVMSGHREAVSAMQFSADGTRLVTGSSDGTVKLWNAGNGDLLLTLTEAQGSVESVAFVRDDRYLVAIADAVYVWDSGEKAH